MQDVRELDKVIEKSEKILWESKPNFIAFIFGSSLPVMIFGLVWLLIAFPFVLVSLFSLLTGNFIASFAVLFFNPMLWIGILLFFGMPIYFYLAYHYIDYAITSKRVIIQRGIIGRDFDMVDFDQISNATVNVGLMDKLLGKNTGSIYIYTPGSVAYTKQGAVPRPFILSSVVNPYEVFKFFKKVSFDVKTDIEYPNQFRPKSNPGYNTKIDVKK
jgi:hypothetical protein